MGVENYVATLRLTPVTDGDKTFLEWSAEFDCAPNARPNWSARSVAVCSKAASMRSSACSEVDAVPHIVKSTILDAPTGAVWDVLRDFNGHDRWHPAVATSAIERAQAADRIGCVRRFKLQDGSELREQLLALSDLEQSFSYCLLDTPIPMFNYVAHVRCCRSPMVTGPSGIGSRASPRAR